MHVGLEKRVRTDQNVDLAGCQALDDRSRAFPFSRPVSSAMRKPAASASGAIVSRCWRASTSVGAINAAWAPAFDRDRHRHQRDDRLPGPDVALQQAQHPVRRGEIGS